MNAEQSVLDRIDEVTVDSCHAPGCGRSLADSVSPWFCGQRCQEAWTAHQNDVQELTGYIEPLGGYGYDGARWRPEGADESLRIPDWSATRLAINPVDARRMAESLTAAFARASEAFGQAGQRMASAMVSGARTRPLFILDQGTTTMLSRPGDFGPVPDPDPARTARMRALEARRNRNTGPQVHADPRRNRR